MTDEEEVYRWFLSISTQEVIEFYLLAREGGLDISTIAKLEYEKNRNNIDDDLMRSLLEGYVSL